MPIIPAPGRLKQEDSEIKASLGYIGGSVTKQNKRKHVFSPLSLLPSSVYLLTYLPVHPSNSSLPKEKGPHV
jgi:hypothetical protein